MSFQVVAVLTAKPGSENVVREAMQGIVGPSREEDGCLAYDLSESVAAAGTFVTVEEWAGPDDLERHMQTPHIQAVLEVLGTELASPPAMHSLTPLDVV